jgi:hypothetical protein
MALSREVFGECTPTTIALVTLRYEPDPRYPGIKPGELQKELEWAMGMSAIGFHWTIEKVSILLEEREGE